MVTKGEQSAQRAADAADRTLTAREAAAVLRISAEAVRKRVQRGTLTGYKRDGKVYVVLPLPDGRQTDAAGQRPDTVPDAGRDVASPPLVEALRSQVDDLRAQLAEATRAQAELRMLLNNALAKVPALPAPTVTPATTAPAPRRRWLRWPWR